MVFEMKVYNTVGFLRARKTVCETGFVEIGATKRRSLLLGKRGVYAHVLP